MRKIILIISMVFLEKNWMLSDTSSCHRAAFSHPLLIIILVMLVISMILFIILIIKD